MQRADMMRRISVLTIVSVLAASGVTLGKTGPAKAPETADRPQVRVLRVVGSPYGWPRPDYNATNTPLRTSIYFVLSLWTEDKQDRVDAESVTVSLHQEGEAPIYLLRPGKRFATGASGWLRERKTRPSRFGPAEKLVVYIDPALTLKARTKYTIRVAARSRGGAKLRIKRGTWSFTTEPAPTVHPLNFSLDLNSKPIHWRGGFFTGFCNLVFCTTANLFAPTYELMDQARKQHPRAWSLDRVCWLTSGNETQRGRSMMNPRVPNLVRERETRRITAIEPEENGVLLRVEDFFGHEQYGIESNRPVSEDYHSGDEVLVSDGINDARAKVLAADDDARTVLLDKLLTPEDGWSIDYRASMPKKEDPDAPGLFAVGGCYLRKFKPHGTACYFWGRVDKEWDLGVGRYNRRLVVNFFDAPAALSRNGRGANTAKDYVQWHEVVRTITGHVIDWYGEKSLDLLWSVFNEPDLQAAFWNPDWDELQRFYDYTVDAVLRAFEDRGYDSQRVFVGGLELGGIFGVHLRLSEFLGHCSPTATTKGALPLNAAFTDPRLDGKRSKRVETLCGANEGRGSPCDFVSVHTYERSEIVAGKLIRAKEMALEIDPEYYRDLWINSHESNPSWAAPPDGAAADSYLGNGYYPSWCADVVGRCLRKAAADPRYAFGETVLTTWPPLGGFIGQAAFTRILSVEDNGDMKTDRRVTIPSPIFHALNLLSDLGDRYWSLPQQQVGEHVVSGFASRDDKGVIRVVLYSHNWRDTQSRSGAEFDVTLELKHPGGNSPVRVREYRFDHNHNSYFHQGKALRDRRFPNIEKIKAVLPDLKSKDPRVVVQALTRLEQFVPTIVRDLSVLGEYVAVITKYSKSENEEIRKATESLIQTASTSGVRPGNAYTPQEVEEIQQLAQLRPTATSTLPRESDGRIRLTARVGPNGVNFLIIEPDRP